MHEQVEEGPGCIYTWRTYQPRAKNQEGAKEGGHNSRERESHVELEFCKDPVQPPVRVQGEAGGAGITSRGEEEIIEVVRGRNGRRVTLRQWLSQYLPPNCRLRWLPEDVEERKE